MSSSSSDSKSNGELRTAFPELLNYLYNVAGVLFDVNSLALYLVLRGVCKRYAASGTNPTPAELVNASEMAKRLLASPFVSDMLVTEIPLDYTASSGLPPRLYAPKHWMLKLMLEHDLSQTALLQVVSGGGKRVSYLQHLAKHATVMAAIEMTEAYEAIWSSPMMPMTFSSVSLLSDLDAPPVMTKPQPKSVCDYVQAVANEHFVRFRVDEARCTITSNIDFDCQHRDAMITSLEQLTMLNGYASAHPEKSPRELVHMLNATEQLMHLLVNTDGILVNADDVTRLLQSIGVPNPPRMAVLLDDIVALHGFTRMVVPLKLGSTALLAFTFWDANLMARFSFPRQEFIELTQSDSAAMQRYRLSHLFKTDTTISTGDLRALYRHLWKHELEPDDAKLPAIWNGLTYDAATSTCRITKQLTESSPVYPTTMYFWHELVRQSVERPVQGVNEILFAINSISKSEGVLPEYLMDALQSSKGSQARAAGDAQLPATAPLLLGVDEHDEHDEEENIHAEDDDDDIEVIVVPKPKATTSAPASTVVEVVDSDSGDSDVEVVQRTTPVVTVDDLLDAEIRRVFWHALSDEAANKAVAATHISQEAERAILRRVYEVAMIEPLL
ncbi:hypothetical protein RI367_002700 [Sorochytrium milnesiophthora]